ncbi:HET-domain-containing protein [Karstenula rhodostoma CBS 690.94]|uniref:HET-domain-containing protein n=1 Tax=Karstenula rhodostoma CBS 690.94 TaxID=1392251 RepID=A0A9P4PK57_9PLEO|nr:HET-domain-containing protein [Karstenula rhodostoma CBS 690.94]
MGCCTEATRRSQPSEKSASLRTNASHPTPAMSDWYPMLPPLHNNKRGELYLSPPNIRILRIPPAPSEADTTDLFECTIQVVSLGKLPQYETISYVWGSVTDQVPILVSGHRIEISRSLSGALRQLQLPDRDRLLWVDQICINQQNLEEKADQVQLMSIIYTKCSRCIAWMGEVRDDMLADADAAVQLIQYMAAASRAQDPHAEPLPPTFPDVFGAAVEALKNIGPDENAWWMRIWTVQEAALPEHVALQWGPFEISWSTLQQAREAWVFNRPQPLSDMIDQYFAGMQILRNLMTHVTWLNLARHRFDDLFEMIHRYRLRQATNPRDKIYGLLGLCEHGRLPVSEICDYGIPIPQVFSTLTQELVLDAKGLRPLTVSPRQQPSESTPNIASWALDLAFTSPKHSPDVYYLMHGYDEYRADEGLGPIDLKAIETEIGQRRLTLTGVHVDVIVQTQNGFLTDKVSDTWPVSTTEPLLHDWYAAAVGCPFSNHDLAGSASRELYPESTYNRAEAFAKLVLGDVVRDGAQQPGRKANDNDVYDVWEIMRGKATCVENDTRNTIYGMMANQNMFVTETGLMGQGHMETEVGDQVWIFRGGKVPFVVRPPKVEGEDGYTFVGQCYVQGVMRGEMASRSGLVQKTISLY